MNNMKEGWIVKNQTYKNFSDYLKERYGEKVYKLPVALPVTCPNRDGSIPASNLTSPKGIQYGCFKNIYLILLFLPIRQEF